jgi:hypothetical protein
MKSFWPDHGTGCARSRASYHGKIDERALQRKNWGVYVLEQGFVDGADAMADADHGDATSGQISLMEDQIETLVCLSANPCNDLVEQGIPRAWKPVVA